MTTFTANRLLATVADVTSYMNPVARGIDETALYTRLLDAASRRVEEYTGREFLPDPAYVSESPIVDTAAPVTRTIALAAIEYGPFQQPALQRFYAVARVPDARSLTAVTSDGTALAADQWELEGRNGEPAARLKFRAIPLESLTVTGRFGFADVPGNVRQATVELVARAVYERNARLADVVQDPEGGVASYFRQLPPSVVSVLDPYRTAVGL